MMFRVMLGKQNRGRFDRVFRLELRGLMSGTWLTSISSDAEKLAAQLDEPVGNDPDLGKEEGEAQIHRQHTGRGQMHR